jgi:hypothetical protein
MKDVRQQQGLREAEVKEGTVGARCVCWLGCNMPSHCGTSACKKRDREGGAVILGSIKVA